MPPKAAIGPDEDVKFLLTIIKQLEGAPDWQRVTDELSLQSKGAAAKRYSRIPGKYGVVMDKKSSGTLFPTKKADKASSVSPDAEDSPKKGKAKPKKGSSKKRKLDEAEEDEEVKAEVESDD